MSHHRRRSSGLSDVASHLGRLSLNASGGNHHTRGSCPYGERCNYLQSGRMPARGDGNPRGGRSGRGRGGRGQVTGPRGARGGARGEARGGSQGGSRGRGRGENRSVRPSSGSGGDSGSGGLRGVDLMSMCRFRAGTGEDARLLWEAVRPGIRRNPALVTIPDRFSSSDKYLETMQGHADAEFAAAVYAARGALEHRDEGGWRPWRALPGGTGAVAVEGCDDWTEEPWMRHALEVEGCDALCLALMSGTRLSVEPPCPDEIRRHLRGPDSSRPEEEGYLIVCGPERVRGMFREEAGGRLRSLGFIGSHLLAYESAQILRQPTGTGHSPLLEQVAAPAPPKRKARGSSGGTLLPSANVDGLDPAVVNPLQREAVRGVKPGLSLIHGPPGTGKSTTIFHLIASRTDPGLKVLVTCTRNQAINAVAAKVGKRRIPV
jgi:hypothetical protein